MAKMNWGRAAKDRNAERYGSVRASETYGPGKNTKKKGKKKLTASKEVRDAVRAQLDKRKSERTVSHTSETPLFDQLGIESAASPRSKKRVRTEQAGATINRTNPKNWRLDGLIELHQREVEERNKAQQLKQDKKKEAEAVKLAAKMDRLRRRSKSIKT